MLGFRTRPVPQDAITPTLRFLQSRYAHRSSFAASRGRVKGAAQGKLLIRHLPRFAPLGAMLNDPVRQGPLEADVMSGFFRLDPLVLENLLPFGLELTIKIGVFHQVICRGIRSFAHKLGQNSEFIGM